VKLTRKIWLLLGLLVGLMLAVDLAFTRHRLAVEAQAEYEDHARTLQALVMAIRRVYQEQFVASGLPIDDSTIGFLPAHAISKIARDFASKSHNGIRFNNVTDRPRNPGNRADRFEMEAIAWFRANPAATERTQDIVDDSGTSYLLYTTPIWIEPFCLRCHGDRNDAPPSLAEKYEAAFDYKENELRGVVSIRIPQANMDETIASSWSVLILKSLVGYALLLVGLGFLLQTLIVRRLAKLKASADKLAAGDFAERVASHGTDELSELAASFNRMADAVEARDRELLKLSHHDALTGLPNRVELENRLDHALALAHRNSNRNALLLLNVDRFKMLNDARGHALGDALLIALGGRLAGLLREGDTLARLGADEFAVMLQGLNPHRDAASNGALAVVEKIRSDLRLPFALSSDEEVLLTVSIGVTLFPDGDSDTGREVLRRANTALHRAKEAGGQHAAFFESGMGETAEHRFRIERELRRAIPTGELRLFLQPQVDESGRRVGAEALVRWEHPERGLLPPGAFIGIAEESSLIVDLGNWVMTESCRLMARETMAGRPLRISVNLSPKQFRQPDFVAWLKNVLAVTGADPAHLTLEVTENLMIENLGEVIAKMSELTALGVHFSIDDFGTGYSSLAYLKRLPIDELKIDKTFIQDAPNDPGDAAVVETIISVARHMHLRIVAEGVETQQQADFLRELASMSYQGYFYGRPEPAEVWLDRWTREGSGR
jgi:diguanylate cyclase (GGDEF)-like protein